MKGRLEMNYKLPKHEAVTFYSEEMQMAAALQMAVDMQKNGKMQEIQFIDSRESSWTIKEMTKYLQEVETEPHQLTVYFDGGFDREGLRTGLGLVIYYEKNGKQFRIRKNLMMKQLQSNNEAEYAALFSAVEELQRLGVHHLPVTFIGDSQVVINQLQGEWPVVDPVLNEWADKIEAALEQAGLMPEYLLVPRKENEEADQLASQALQGIEIESRKEINEKV